MPQQQSYGHSLRGVYTIPTEYAHYWGWRYYLAWVRPGRKEIIRVDIPMRDKFYKGRIICTSRGFNFRDEAESYLEIVKNLDVCDVVAIIKGRKVGTLKLTEDVAINYAKKYMKNYICWVVNLSQPSLIYNHGGGLNV